MTPLCELCIKYGTDKGPREMGGWGYSPIYHSLFESWRDKVKRVLEIGVCGNRDIPNNRTGASLFVWRDYFPNAEIIGIDNDARWMVNDEPRIKTYCFDAYDSHRMWNFLMDEGAGSYDFICDDAVHDPIFQVLLLDSLWPSLAYNGVYAIEDVCPYKLPQNNVNHLARFYPEVLRSQEFMTHKDERLLILR